MPRQRRPKMVGAALVPGLRMDADLERAFIAYAESQAHTHGTEVNLTSAARDLLRRGLRMCSNEHSCEKEGFYKGLAEARKRLGESIAGVG